GAVIARPSGLERVEDLVERILPDPSLALGRDLEPARRALHLARLLEHLLEVGHPELLVEEAVLLAEVLHPLQRLFHVATGLEQQVAEDLHELLPELEILGPRALPFRVVEEHGAPPRRLSRPRARPACSSACRGSSCWRRRHARATASSAGAGPRGPAPSPSRTPPGSPASDTCWRACRAPSPRRAVSRTRPAACRRRPGRGFRSRTSRAPHGTRRRRATRPRARRPPGRAPRPPRRARRTRSPAPRRVGRRPRLARVAA